MRVIAGVMWLADSCSCGNGRSPLRGPTESERMRGSYSQQTDIRQVSWQAVR